MNDHLHALPAGHLLGEYRIDDVLGSGGFGITYLATDTRLGKLVAIKEYLPGEFALRTGAIAVKPKSPADQADYQWGLKRFLDEARTLASFDHPHLNEVYRFLEDNGTAYMVLEYIEGETLSVLLRRKSRLDSARLRRLLDELLSGLEEVHAAGFVHRDIKPANIIFRKDGAAVLIDFGAARQAVGQRSQNITTILTPGYAPIEQYDRRADDMGPWTDLYALGMVAYRCLSGIRDAELLDAVARARLEYNNEKHNDLAVAIRVGEGRYDDSLLKAVDWAIEVNERRRPRSVAALRAMLEGRVADREEAERQRKAEEEIKHFTAVFGREASPDAKDASGMTDLHYVAAANMPELAKFLLDAGARVDARIKAEWNPHTETSKRKLEELTKEGAFIYHYDGGVTSLYLAALYNARDMAGLLIAHGADVNVKGTHGDTPLHNVAQENAHAVAELLIAHGADVNAKDNDGCTPLYSAALSNARAVAELLIAHGADVNHDATLLHAAAFGNSPDMAELLIARGADVNAKDNDGSTPLHDLFELYDSSNGKGYRLMEMLIDHGADVNAKNNDGCTPLYSAAHSNARAVAELLIAHGADVNAKTSHDDTLLHAAAFGNSPDMAELLIARGADVNAKDNNGCTPLHDAARKNARAVAELLIDNGADINAKDKDGWAPRDIAQQNGHSEMACFLR